MGVRVKMVSGSEIPIIVLFDARDRVSNVPLEWVKVNELGASNDFFHHPASRSGLHGRCCFGNVESTLESIHKHLYDLLGNHSKFWFRGSFRASTPLPMLQNIQTLHVYATSDVPQVDEFLSKSTSLECVFWRINGKQQVTLRENSRLYEMDTVYLWTSCSLATDLMKHFNGRHAFLISRSINPTDVIQFLNAWKSGEQFRNLEVMIMDYKIDSSPIRNSIEFKNVNTEVEYSFARKFPKDLQFSEYPSFSWELKSHSYLVRESDGHVATVMISPFRTSIGVWNMTETEFLQKFR